jgi:glycine cleavage system regulatory protein
MTVTSLVLTVIGDDRAGLVAAIADAVDSHGGNWETSQLAELAGTFAGVIQVSVPPAHADALTTELEALEGLQAVVVRAPDAAAAPAHHTVSFQILGNDNPGIVREISSALRGRSLSIESMSTETRDAAMAGGRLFEATATVRLPVDVDLSEVVADLERIASEIRVDVTFAD